MLRLIFAISLALGAASARADEVEDFYKGRTIYALVGVSAGGEYDFQLRLVAKYLGKYIPGRPTIVAQNMVGATGMLMANHLYRVAPKDGTYIGLIQNGLPATQAVGGEGVQFDAAKFNWLGAIAPTNETMATWKTTGIKTIEDAIGKEIIAGAIGSAGITLGLPIMLNDLLGTRFKMVTGYTGSGNLDIAMERGEVSARANAWSSLRASHADWIRNHDINILIHTGPKPPDLADVPAIEDFLKSDADRAVVDIVTVGDRLGHPFAAAPDVPPARVAALRSAFSAMLRDPDFIRDAQGAKIDINPATPEVLQKAVRAALGASAEAKGRAKKYFQ